MSKLTDLLHKRLDSGDWPTDRLIGYEEALGLLPAHDAEIVERAKREQMVTDCDLLDRLFGKGSDPANAVANAWAKAHPEVKIDES